MAPKKGKKGESRDVPPTSQPQGESISTRVSNIASGLADRGEPLKGLESKTAKLEESSSGFAAGAKQLREQQQARSEAMSLTGFARSVVNALSGRSRAQEAPTGKLDEAGKLDEVGNPAQEQGDLSQSIGNTLSRFGTALTKSGSPQPEVQADIRNAQEALQGHKNTPKEQAERLSEVSEDASKSSNPVREAFGKFCAEAANALMAGGRAARRSAMTKLQSAARGVSAAISRLRGRGKGRE